MKIFLSAENLDSFWDIPGVSGLHQMSKIYILLDLQFEVHGGRPRYPRMNLNFQLYINIFEFFKVCTILYMYLISPIICRLIHKFFI